ncbi:hypothetical protein [Nocardioides sp. 503]|uniref:hypothetical protein n=1 Tax=Nocardioides sp. 503 TaxID=2508326 RepID=UPI00106FCFB1|nr:hypothetical protein [Nocardioides sp. 503]
MSEETPASGWFAHAPLGVEDGLDDEGPPVGVIRLGGDYGGAALWDERGGIGEEPDYLGRHLGLSPELVADTAEWGQDWDGGRGPAHDERGRVLLARLRDECPGREFVLRL